MEHLTYLALLTVWALPVIGLHWLVGAPELRRHARTLLIGVVVPTLYLTASDAIAITAGAWHISDDLILGPRWRGLVLEEVIFFVLTNVMLVQSLILFLEPEPRRRVWAWLHRARSRRSQSAPAEKPTATTSRR